MTIEQAIEHASYWRDLSDCTCASELPSGGCCKCDMDSIIEVLNDAERANQLLSKALVGISNVTTDRAAFNIASNALRKLEKQPCRDTNKREYICLK